MSAGEYRFIVDAGATLTRVFTLKPAEEWDNLVEDVRMKARRKKAPKSEVFSAILGDGFELGPEDNQFTMSIDPTVTGNLSSGVHQFDLEIVLTTGRVIRLLEGDFFVREEITK